MEKKAILFLDNSYTFGGAIISLHYLLKGMDKTKFQPILITCQSEDIVKKYFSEFIVFNPKMKIKWRDNHIYCRITSLPLYKIEVIKKFIDKVRTVYWEIFINTPQAFRHYAIGKKYNVALVHLNNGLSHFPGILAAKLLKVPCISHRRGPERMSRSLRFYTKSIDHHIAISNAIKDYLIMSGVAREKITVVYNAVDLDDFDVNCNLEKLREEFSIKDEQPLLGIFGRVIAWKGIKEFIQAASLVFKEVPQAKAFIVGGISDGDERYLAEVKKIAEENGVLDKFVFTGYRDDVAPLMKLMDVVVHASIIPEPFGRVLIEAMAMGKPVVAIRAGGPLDVVVDGETGFLVAMKDTDEMASAVIKILKSPTRAKEMGMRGRKRVEEVFCNKRYVMAVEEIYSSMIKDDEIRDNPVGAASCRD